MLRMEEGGLAGLQGATGLVKRLGRPVAGISAVGSLLALTGLLSRW